MHLEDFNHIIRGKKCNLHQYFKQYEYEISNPIPFWLLCNHFQQTNKDKDETSVNYI